MFYRKKQEEIIPLTDNEIKKLKDGLVENENLSVTDLDIKDLVPQSFDQGVVNIIKDSHMLFLHDNIDMDKFRTFKKSKGGRFNQDVLDYTRNKDHGKYLLIKTNNKKTIVRLIEDEDILLYKTLKLIDGIIKDKPYMLFKTLDESDTLISSMRYIKEINEDVLIDSESIPLPSTELEDVNESRPTSISLFDE